MEREREWKDVGKRRDKLSLLVAEKLCRQFADKFQAALPRELRDLVYEHVWDDLVQDLTFDDVTLYATTPGPPQDMDLVRSTPVLGTASTAEKISKPWSVSCTEHPCRCFDWWELPTWAQHQFVDMDTAREVAAAYYRLIQPKCLGKELHELQDFLSVDHFHLGVKPTDDIRRLEINLDTGRVDSTSFYEALLPLLEDDCVLYKVRAMRSFHLSFKLLWEGSHAQDTPVLQYTRPIVTKLQKAGAKVSLLAFQTTLRHTYDVSDYYTLNASDWATKWSNGIKKGFRNMRWEDAVRYGDDIPDLAAMGSFEQSLNSVFYGGRMAHITTHIGFPGAAQMGLVNIVLTVFPGAGPTTFPAFGPTGPVAGPPGPSGTNTTGSNTAAAAPAPPIGPPAFVSQPSVAHGNNAVNNNAHHASDSEDSDK
jgi:hypothetical protein